MLTIVSIPKAFTTPHTAIIQENAIKSWTILNPKPEIILFGNDEGVAEIAKKYNIRHIPEIRVNKLGTPLLSSLFSITEKEASNELICYSNSDVMLFQDLIDTVSQVKLSNFLILGQRWDYGQKTYIEFESQKYAEQYLRIVKFEGVLHAPVGSDYFIYKKNNLKSIPEFTVGRAGWDNWFISYFRKNNIPVIDASKSISVVHQNHDYGHIKERRGNQYAGTESDINMSLIPKNEALYTIMDSDFYISDGKIKKSCGIRYIIPRLRRINILYKIFILIKRTLFRKKAVS